MSNPGVLVLFSSKNKIGNIKYLQIEDNIGESIHIHLNEFRLDLSINDFNKIKELAMQALIELDEIPSPTFAPPSFLYEIYRSAGFAKVNYNVKKVQLNTLKFIVRTKLSRLFTTVNFLNIKDTPHVKFIQNLPDCFDSYDQTNAFGIDNKTRISRAVQYVDSSPLASLDYSLVVFGENNLVRDGLHTAAAICNKYGDNTEVNVVQIRAMDALSKVRVSLYWTLRLNLKMIYKALRRVAATYLR